ncbi:MAG: hypothetical protein U0936_13890 [Planctomycetaceae bacterium]
MNSLQAARESARASELAWLAEHGEYSSEMIRASELFRRGEIGPMNDLLKRFHRTKVLNPRGFEWHYLWHQGSTFRSMPGHAGIPAAAEFSADRSRLYSIADDDTLRQWNTTTFQEEAAWSLGANSTVRNTRAASIAMRLGPLLFGRSRPETCRRPYSGISSPTARS